jgi:hypothetical protein
MMCATLRTVLTPLSPGARQERGKWFLLLVFARHIVHVLLTVSI